MKKAFVAAVLLGYLSSTVYTQDRPVTAGRAPDEYGRVIIKQSSAPRAGFAPVVFDHWVHRSKFTCRLCHTDIGFEI